MPPSLPPPLGGTPSAYAWQRRTDRGAHLFGIPDDFMSLILSPVTGRTQALGWHRRAGAAPSRVFVWSENREVVRTVRDEDLGCGRRAVFGQHVARQTMARSWL